MRLSFLLSFLLLSGFLALTSCQKENIDQTNIKEDENTPDSTGVNCDDLSIVLEFDSDNYVLTALVDGGTPAYSYEWNTGETTPSIAINAPGIYTVQVIDSEGCALTATTEIELGDPCDDLSVTLEFNPTNNELTASPNGGTAPYSYAWSSGENTASIMPSAPGVYTVEVSDAAGCVVAASYTLSGNDPCASFTGVSFSFDSLTQELTALPQGGQAPYSYEWSTGETSPTITTQPGETYTVLVTDNLGCTQENYFETQGGGGSGCMDVSISHNPASSTLTANVVSGGVAPFQYLWSTGESTQSITVNALGMYYVVVTDSDGCTATTFIEL